MTVSRLLGYSLLVILLGIVLGLAPVSAGEHPWDGNNNNPNDSTTITNGGSDDDPQTPTDPSNPDVDEPLFGNPLLLWWQLAVQYPATGNNASVQAVTKGASENTQTEVGATGSTRSDR